MWKYLKLTGLYGSLGAFILCGAKLVGQMPEIGWWWCTAPLWLPTWILIHVLGLVSLLALLANNPKNDEQ